MAAVTSGMSTASTTSTSGVRANARRPASSPATGPPSGGSSRTKVTGRLVGTCSPTTTTSPDAATAASARSRNVCPACSMRRLVGTVQPRGGAAGEDHGRDVHPPTLSGRASGRLGVVTLSVALVQLASGLDPDGNRALLDGWCPTHPTARPGRPPGGVRARLRRGRLRRRPVRRGRRTVRSRREVARVADARGTTVLAGMFEVSDDPARPFNTLVVRGAVDGRLPQDPPLRLLRLPRVGPALAPATVSAVTAGFGDFTLGLMTCYDLRFPEQARALVDAGADVLVVPSAWVAGERKVDHWRTLVRARAIENTAYVVAVGQPGPRYSGHSMVVDPLGDVLVEAGEDPETLVGDARPRGARAGPPDQPLAGQPAPVAFAPVAQTSPRRRAEPARRRSRPPRSPRLAPPSRPRRPTSSPTLRSRSRQIP